MSDRLDLSTVRKAHLIGIGGIGVSAVARLLIARGIDVSGSDVRESSITKALKAEGAQIFIGHKESNLTDADIVVVSTAIPETNVELIAARKAGLKVVHRSIVLDALMVGHRTIGVTGTNGKGSVAALVTWLLEAASLNPSFAIGAILIDFGTNAKASYGRYLVCELDESDGSFTNTHPDVLVINNLEADHLNYYKDLSGVLRTFTAYLSGTSVSRIHANGDDGNVTTVLRQSSRKAVTFGRGSTCDYRILSIETIGFHSRFYLCGPKGALGWFELRLPGEYNVFNAVAALSVAFEEGVDPDVARRALPAFSGLENRFSCSKIGEYLIVKDYISHPTGIRSVIEAARAFAEGRIIAVFKPYRFTMIHYLQDEYSVAFRGADLTLITEMYTAGEVPIPGVDTKWLCEKVRAGGSEVIFVPEMDKIVQTIRNLISPKDTVIFFGGDDLFEVAKRLEEELS